MKVEYLGKVGYRKEYALQNFFIGMTEGLEYIKKCNKKIILLGGAGEHGIWAEVLLQSKGISIYGYADNSPKLQGKYVRGKRILSPYQLFDEDEYYIIISVANPHINCVRLQLMTHGVNEYGIFLSTSFHDFEDEDVKLQNQLMETINEICFENELLEDALPYVGLSVGGDGGQLGFLNWLLKSTTWSHWAYLWERDILSNCNKQKVLEIGPGYGLMSAVVLKEFPNARVDWILFGKQNSSLAEQKSEGYVKGLRKIKEKYSGQIKEIWGQIEREKFCIEEGDYDLIIMTEVFEHFVLNPIATLIKLKNALTGDGSIVFTTPNWGHVHIYEKWEDLPSEENVDDEKYELLTKCGHTYQYNKSELDEIFMRSGLRVVEYRISDSNNHNYILKRDDSKPRGGI